jgi:decaprenylphospho-beta-D-ribofuranose 2-oxidase
LRKFLLASDVPKGRQEIHGFGRHTAMAEELYTERLESTLNDNTDVSLCRGLGRSYGDSSLPTEANPKVVNTTFADRILDFDPKTGLLRAEAGLSLVRINQRFLRNGFFPPVTPGTQFVTLGGMVAADVHGKGHHVAGTFGEHVTRLKMRVASGEVIWCAPDDKPELFWATVGGMGLTGHILEVEFRMRTIPSPWIMMETERISNIDAFQSALTEAAKKSPYTMGWIDCASSGSKMGRGVLMSGRWAEPHEASAKKPSKLARPTFPFELPSWAVNRLTVSAFNELYFRMHPRGVHHSVVHPEKFFYPLDAVREWNRLYGKRGFTQYQCVLPRSAGPGSARRFLETLTSMPNGASFLCVIKDCGKQGHGMLSFPMEGISIACDIPVRESTQELVDTLNRQVIAEGGRIYLAKDSFTRAEDFRSMEPRLAEFERLRKQWDPEGKLSSAQSERLFSS